MTIDMEHHRANKFSSASNVRCCIYLWEGGPLDTLMQKTAARWAFWPQWAPHAQGQALRGSGLVSLRSSRITK